MSVKIDSEHAIAHNNMLLARESENMALNPATALAGVQAILTDPSKGFYLVAEERHTIIGQLMITYEWSDWNNTMMWWIQSVYTKREWRKHGVFMKLLNEIQQRARDQASIPVPQLSVRHLVYLPY
jgi:GNAT superfamily N-acetyltransferase